MTDEELRRLAVKELLAYVKGEASAMCPASMDYWKKHIEEIVCKENKVKGCYFGKDELGQDFFAKCDCVDCQKRTLALLDLRKAYLNKINKENELLKEIADLKKESAKAKEIIKGFVNSNGFISANSRFYEKAEEFLKEVY